MSDDGAEMVQMEGLTIPQFYFELPVVGISVTGGVVDELDRALYAKFMMGAIRMCFKDCAKDFNEPELVFPEKMCVKKCT